MASASKIKEEREPLVLSNSTFFTLFRRKGFSETLEVLDRFPKDEALQSKFFNALEEFESYPNNFFRNKKDLLKYKLISYKLNENNDKVLYLTAKGKEILENIYAIEDKF